MSNVTKLVLKLADLWTEYLQAACDAEPLNNQISGVLQELCSLRSLVEYEFAEAEKQAREAGSVPGMIWRCVIENDPDSLPVSLTAIEEGQYVLSTERPLLRSTALMLDLKWPGKVILNHRPVG